MLQSYKKWNKIKKVGECVNMPGIGAVMGDQCLRIKYTLNSKDRP